MKKLIIILCLCLSVFTSFAGRVVVVEVTKDGTGWQNLFNCYQRVTTELISSGDNITYVNLNCLGAGYNWCRASRSIGSLGHVDAVENQQIVAAIDALIAISETSAQSGVLRGTSSKKVGVTKGGKTELYLINATWQYQAKDLSKARITITIDLDDSNLLNPRTRQ